MTNDKVENTISINGVAVKKIQAGLRGGLDVYQPVSEVGFNTLYFVKGDVLLFTQFVSPDYSPRTGYVDTVSFENSKTNPNNETNQ